MHPFWPTLRRTRLLAILTIVTLLTGVNGIQLCQAQMPRRNSGDDWPTLHGDLCRSGYSPEFPEGNLRLAWRKALYPELIGPRCQVIVGAGLACMGTYSGNLYAWDAITGKERWVFRAEGPFGHAPMIDQDRIFAACMDHRVYALAVDDGRVAWTFTANEGFWTSPVVYQGNVYCGSRDGIFYALRASDGELLWTHASGAPILTTASICETGQRILFAAEDMRVRCLDVTDGHLLWESPPLPGLSMRDYFPLIAQGIVILTTNPLKDFHATLDDHQQMLLQRTGFAGGDPRYIPATPQAVRDEQQAIVRYLQDHPHEQTFFAFRVADGSIPWTAPVLYTAGLHNPPSPPCHHLDSGDVFVFLRTAYGTWDGGGEVRPYTGVGRLNLETGDIALVDHAHRPAQEDRPPGARDLPFASFSTIGDETQALSCGPQHLLSNHQGTLGLLDLRSLRTKVAWGKRDSYAGFYGPANFGWEQDGGPQRARAANEPYGLVNEWHGPARGIAAVAQKRIYYAVGSQVLCLEPQP